MEAYNWYFTSKTISGRMKKSIIKPVIVLFVVQLAMISSAQNSEVFFKVYPSSMDGLPLWCLQMYSENPRVDEVSDLYDTFYKKNPFIKTIHTQNFKYWLKEVEGFVGSDGYIHLPTPKEKKSILKSIKAQRGASTKVVTIWNEAGPFNTYKNNGGLELRPTQTNVSSIAVAPSNSDVIYCGAATGGGIFKSIDHGLNWSLVSLLDPITNANDIKVHPNDPDIVYLSNGSALYKTIDGGDNWTLIYNAPGTIEQFYIHRTQPNIVYAATANGLFRSTNDGSTWSNIFNHRCWDIEAHVLNPDIIYLSVNNSVEVRAEIYKSIDNGATWILKDSSWYIPTDLLNASDLGCKIGVTPADPDRVYAGLIGSSKSGDNGWIGIYYSLDGADSWVNPDGIDGGPYAPGNDMSTNWFVAGYSSGYHQGWYNFDLDVSHIDPDKLWVGTIWACESGNRGANIEYIRGTRSLSMHADIQDIDVIGNEIWYTSDGGINYSTDEMLSVETRNTGVSASTYWGFSSGWNTDVWTGGRYHNGDAVFHENYGFGNTLFLGGAETSTGYINPLDNRRAHFSDISDKFIPTSLSQVSTNLSNLSVYPNEAYTTLNSSELEYHPNYSNHQYLGKDNVFYKSVDGGITFDSLFTFAITARVLEFEISRENPNTIYCLVRDGGQGTIFKSLNGGTSFGPVSPIPSSNISRLDLSINPEDQNMVWVISSNGANGQKVYLTTDGGDTWQNKTTTALDGHQPLDILYQSGTNDLVYLASNYAVFFWDQIASDWIIYSDGLPLLTRALRFKPFYRDSKLRLSSSRGIWEAPFAVNSIPTVYPMTENDVVYCQRDTIQFEDYSFLDHSGSSWQWNFSPAPAYISNSNIRNPRVVFGSTGSYDVTLTITDGLGTTSTNTLLGMVTVQNQCIADTVPGLSLFCQSSPDHANIPDLEISQTDNFTISAWVKPNGLQSAYTGIVFNDGTSAGLNFRAGNYLAYHWPGGSWSWNSGLIVDSNKWSHVAMVVTPTAITLYLNGIASTHLTAVSPSDIGTMRMGSYKGWSSRNYDGELDEVSIWNTALTQGQIRELRHLTRTGPTPFTTDLVAYYQFNLLGSSEIMDRINLHHASLNGDAQKVISTAPIGGGESHRLTVSSPSSHLFGNTEVVADFDASHPNGEVVATRLNILPDSLPSSNPSVGIYWIVNNYGTSNFDPIISLELDPVSGYSFGDPSDALLYIRDENEHMNNWIQACGATNLDSGSYTYTLPCNLTNLHQFFIQSADSNEITSLYPGIYDSLEICLGDSSYLENAYQSVAGIYYDTINYSPLIDSILVTSLSVNPAFITNILDTICLGDSLVFGSQTLMSSGDYAEVYTTMEGCDSTINLALVVEDCTAGINENLESNVSITPNPTSGNVVISFEGGIIKRVMIYDQLGRLIAEHEQKSGDVDVIVNIASYAVGVYTLIIETDQSQFTARLVKE